MTATKTPAGLSHSQAAALLQKSGPNELESEKTLSTLHFILKALREPMVALLVTCAAIYFFVGKAQDAVLLVVSVLAVIAITIYQEFKSGRAIEALRDLSAPKARVLRDNEVIQIVSRDVVPGDVLVLTEGDRITADCVLAESSTLQVDESLLTGESVPVDKHSSAGEPVRLFASTLVVSGYGSAVVTATGMATQVGKIGASLSSAPQTRTRLQLEMTRMVRFFGIAGIFASVFVTTANVLATRDWSESILAGLASAMALLPEEFPVVLTVFLALGAWRLSKTNVLVRHPISTENLGAISALCVDKTGTLTLNRMEVASVRPMGDTGNFEILECAVLASRSDTFDPMEKAIARGFQELRPRDESRFSASPVIQEYPLSPKVMAMSMARRTGETDQYVVSTKGAPEAVAQLCSLDGAELQHASAIVQEMGKLGLRVIAVAEGIYSGAVLPSTQHQFKLKLIGFVGLNDPVRPEVPPAIAECHTAGIRVIMMTGDHSITASHIGMTAGIQNFSRVMTGPESETLSDDELGRQVGSFNIYARMQPAQKLRILKALKSQGAIVAMVGDGVNDAPSLKWADVGIAMGKRGTDVAREASDIVLLDDCFSSIVASVRIGRNIYENIRSSISYILAIHVPIAGMTLLPAALGLPAALLPVHIVFMELIIDPTCTLIFESLPPDSNTMRRPPRDLAIHLFNKKDVARSSLQGFVMFTAVFAIYFLSLRSGYSLQAARTQAFCTFVFCNLSLVGVHRPRVLLFQSRAYVIIAGLAIATLVAVVNVTFLKTLFGFAGMSLTQWVFAAGTASISTLINYTIRDRAR